MLDLGTGHKRTVAQAGRTWARPLVSGDFVVWSVREDCDAPGNLPDDVPTGAFAYNLRTNEVRQISSYVEPYSLFHEDVALIHESCFATFRVYAVFLGAPHS